VVSKQLGGLVGPFRLVEPGRGDAAGAAHAAHQLLVVAARLGVLLGKALAVVLLVPPRQDGRPVVEGVGVVETGVDPVFLVTRARRIDETERPDRGIGPVLEQTDEEDRLAVERVVVLVGEEYILGRGGEVGVADDHLTAHLVHGDGVEPATVEVAAGDVGSADALGGRGGRLAILAVRGLGAHVAPGHGVAGLGAAAAGIGFLRGRGQIGGGAVSGLGPATDELALRHGGGGGLGGAVSGRLDVFVFEHFLTPFETRQCLVSTLGLGGADSGGGCSDGFWACLKQEIISYFWGFVNGRGLGLAKKTGWWPVFELVIFLFLRFTRRGANVYLPLPRL